MTTNAQKTGLCQQRVPAVGCSVYTAGHVGMLNDISRPPVWANKDSNNDILTSAKNLNFCRDQLNDAFIVNA